MRSRVWAYGFFALCLIAGLVYWKLSLNVLERQTQKEQERQTQELLRQWDSYLSNQTDERKLVTLLKQMPEGEYEVLKRIALRAYALNKKSRDIALLASYFDDSLKKEVIKLDPLHNLQD